MATVTLTRRVVNKNGGAAYTRPGIRSSVYFNKLMFTGEPPAEIQLTADNLAEPGEVKPRADAAEKAAKAKARADKAVAKAEKARVNAEKAAALADKYAKSAPATVNA